VYTPDFQLAEVNVDGKTYKCILKDLQFDKVSDRLNHVDLLELVEDKKVTATIPLKFVGAAAGVKAGGKLVTKMKSLKVKTLPKYLRENIEVDITNLELNANIRVEDVKLENYEIMNSPRIPIASVIMTRQLKQEEAAAPAAKGAASAAKAAAPAAKAAAPAAKK
jgi:large subunit ribosomal protein L25